MAFTTPSTQVTGYVVTASDWNELVNNWLASGLKAVTTDGDMIVATGANAVERVAVMNASNLLLHEVGGLELDISAITTGGLLYGASAGVMAILVAGTDGQFLSQASGIPAWAAAGDFALIGTVEASDSATITVTGLDITTYETYVFSAVDILTANNGVQLRMRWGDSGGIDSGGSDYEGDSINIHGGTVGGSNTGGGDHMRLLAGIGNVGGRGAGFDGVIYTGDATIYTSMTGKGFSVNSDGALRLEIVGYRRTAALTLTQVQLFASSGNITSGRLTVWGLKHD